MTAHSMNEHTTSDVSAGSKTSIFSLGRKRFNSLLHGLLGQPTDKDWGKANLIVDKDQVSLMSIFGINIDRHVDYIEVFTDTLVAPVLAIHLTFPDDAVIVAMPRLYKGICRETDQIIAEKWGDIEVADEDAR